LAPLAVAQIAKGARRRQLSSASSATRAPPSCDGTAMWLIGAYILQLTAAPIAGLQQVPWIFPAKANGALK